MASEIRNPQLWQDGRLKIDWVRHHMPLLNGLEEEFRQTLPFKGKKVALSVHLEAKTAYLCEVLAAGGAEMYVTGSNPLSTQDDVAAALVEAGLNVFAWYDATPEEYEAHIRRVLEVGPNIIIDDGGDLVNLMHTEYTDLIPGVIGGCEETTTGILRLIQLNNAKALKFPMMLVNNADCKHLFDNRYGTGQSVWDGINRTTNLIVAGKNVVVAGYGWCGKGVAMRAKGLGAEVIVTEVDPIKAMEAVMDGFKVMKMEQAASLGDIFVTVTGCDGVIVKDHFLRMKDGAICCNAGHFDCEVDVAGLHMAGLLDYAVANWDKTDDAAIANQAKIAELLPVAVEKSEGEKKAIYAKMLELKDYFVDKSVWIIGGDGWRIRATLHRMRHCVGWKTSWDYNPMKLARALQM